MCVCVCMYVCMYVCMCLYSIQGLGSKVTIIGVYMYIYIHLYISTYKVYKV